MMWGLTRYAKLRKGKKVQDAREMELGGRCQEIIKDEDLQQILSRHEDESKKKNKKMHASRCSGYRTVAV